MNLQTATRFEELLSAPADASPYEYAMLFSAEGWMARRRSRVRFKLLKSLDVKLRRILRAEERVYFATSGTTVTFGEQFFMGWAAVYLNMRALIFTTERVLLLQVDSRRRPRELVSQIPYTAIAQVKSTWNGMCQIKLRNGETYKFQRVPKGDRKFIAQFLGELVGGAAPSTGGPQGVEHLCPHCFVHVREHPDSCPSCLGGFKLVRRAATLSLIFPGLGDWYLGHRTFAAMEMFGGAIAWFGLVLLPLFGPPDPEYPPPDAAGWAIIAIMLAVGHVVDAVMTRHFARKGHHPAGRLSPGNAPLQGTA